MENELENLKNIDSVYFRGKNLFEDDVNENYLVFQPVYKWFKKSDFNGHISA